MKKLMILSIAVVMLTGLLIACGGEKEDDGASGSDDYPDEFSVGVSLPEGAVIEDSVTFEVDESKGNEHRYSRESPVG